MGTRCAIDDDKLVRAFRKWPTLFKVPVPAFDDIGAYNAAFIAKQSARWDGVRADHGWTETIPDLAGVVSVIRDKFEPALARAAAAQVLQP